MVMRLQDSPRGVTQGKRFLVYPWLLSCLSASPHAGCFLCRGTAATVARVFLGRAVRVVTTHPFSVPILKPRQTIIAWKVNTRFSS
jgi:hypothetical protein